MKDPAVAGYMLARAGIEVDRCRALLGTVADRDHQRVSAEIERGAREYQAQLEAALCRVAVSAKGSATTKSLVGRNRLGWSVNSQQQEQAEQLEQLLHVGREEASARFFAMLEKFMKQRDADG